MIFVSLDIINTCTIVPTDELLIVIKDALDTNFVKLAINNKP